MDFGCQLVGDEWYLVLNESGGTWDLGMSRFYRSSTTRPSLTTVRHGLAPMA